MTTIALAVLVTLVLVVIAITQIVRMWQAESRNVVWLAFLTLGLLVLVGIGLFYPLFVYLRALFQRG